MFSYLTTLLGNNVGLTSSSAILTPPVGGYGALSGIPYNDLQGPLGVQGHRGAQGMRTEASLYVSCPLCDRNEKRMANSAVGVLGFCVCDGMMHVQTFLIRSEDGGLKLCVSIGSRR